MNQDQPLDNSHPDDEAISSYLDGWEQQWAYHLRECESCGARLAVFTQVRDQVAALPAVPQGVPPLDDLTRKRALAAALAVPNAAVPVPVPDATVPVPPVALPPAGRRWSWALPASAGAAAAILVAVLVSVVLHGDASNSNVESALDKLGSRQALDATGVVNLGEITDAAALVTKVTGTEARDVTTAQVAAGAAQARAANSGTTGDATSTASAPPAAAPTAAAADHANSLANSGASASAESEYAGATTAAANSGGAPTPAADSTIPSTGPLPCESRVAALNAANGPLVYRAVASFQGQAVAVFGFRPSPGGGGPLTLVVVATAGADCRVLLATVAP